MTFDTTFERSHAPNTMNAEKDKAPELPKRVWITWDDAYPWPTPEMGGDEYVHVDLLATARKEAREAAFRDIRERVEATNPKLTFGSANESVMKKCILMEISDLEGATHERTVENETA